MPELARKEITHRHQRGMQKTPVKCLKKNAHLTPADSCEEFLFGARHENRSQGNIYIGI